MRFTPVFRRKAFLCIAQLAVALSLCGVPHISHAASNTKSARASRAAAAAKKKAAAKLKQLKAACKRHPSTAQCRKLAKKKAPAKKTSAKSASKSAGSPIPELATWESKMKSFGKQHCETLQAHQISQDELLSSTYYDAQAVYLQIADYTKDASWKKCADAARRVYRDEYVMPNDGRVPGFWNFTGGLTLDYLENKDQRSKEAAIKLARNAAYSVDETPLDWTSSTETSREVAYAILAYVHAEELGEPRRPRLTQLVDQALDHIDQWFVKKNAPYMRPFMVGLTARALITYEARTHDKRVLPAIKLAMDSVWAQSWVPEHMSLRYTDRQINAGDLDPAPDLNMLIAPAYAWLYKQTGDSSYRDRADKLFVGSVKGAFLNGAKQFDQSYLWAFSYVKWRNEGDQK